MGLGPNNTSLLERVGFRLTAIAEGSADVDMEREQQARSKTLLIGRIQHGKKKSCKPLAPVKQIDSHLGKNKRLWLWQGEAIPSVYLAPGHLYTTVAVRSAGFRLPKLVKHAKQKY